MTIHSDDSTPVAPDDESARSIQEGLNPAPLPTEQREALLRRILDRIGGEPPLAPAPERGQR